MDRIDHLDWIGEWIGSKLSFEIETVHATAMTFVSTQEWKVINSIMMHLSDCQARSNFECLYESLK